MRELDNRKLNNNHEAKNISKEDIIKIVGDKIKEYESKISKIEEIRKKETESIERLCEKASLLESKGLNVDISFVQGANKIHINSTRKQLES